MRADRGSGGAQGRTAGGDAPSELASGLWQHKSQAEEATRLINRPQALQQVADAIGKAGKVFIIGMGDDDIHARMAALRLSQLGILAVHNFDAAHMASSLSAAKLGDVLLVFSEHGMQASLSHLCRYARELQALVVTVTRHSGNALRAQADLPLLVSAHDERAHVEPLLYQSALQHLVDQVFVLLCAADAMRHARLRANLARIQPLWEP